jgi:hypothetical protein
MNISDLAEDYLVDRKEVLRKLTACNRPRRGEEEMKSFTACFMDSLPVKDGSILKFRSLSCG